MIVIIERNTVDSMYMGNCPSSRNRECSHDIYNNIKDVMTELKRMDFYRETEDWESPLTCSIYIGNEMWTEFWTNHGWIYKQKAYQPPKLIYNNLKNGNKSSKMQDEIQKIFDDTTTEIIKEEFIKLLGQFNMSEYRTNKFKKLTALLPDGKQIVQDYKDNQKAIQERAQKKREISQLAKLKKKYPEE